MERGANRLTAGLYATGAVALLISMFLDWYPVIEGAYFNRSVGAPEDVGVFSSYTDSWLNAWEAFSVVDVVLVACAAAALGAALMVLRTGASRVAGAVAASVGALGLGIVVWRMVDEPFEFDTGSGAGVGSVIAACSLAVIAVAGILATASARSGR